MKISNCNGCKHERNDSKTLPCKNCARNGNDFYEARVEQCETCKRYTPDVELINFGTCSVGDMGTMRTYNCNLWKSKE